MAETVSRIQARLQPRLEIILPRLAGPRLSAADLARQFGDEIRAASRTDAQGRRYAPDQYTLSLSSKDLAHAEKPMGPVQEELSAALAEALQACGFVLLRAPHVTIASDPTLREKTARLITWHSRDPLQLTENMNLEPAGSEDIPTGAFLVVEGRRHFPLRKSVVAIGRSPENDLLLGDPHVSRRHAELRAREGRYVLFDLDSTTGTRVNGQLVREKTLEPGDVIALANVDLIYGEDPAGPPDFAPPYKPPSKPRMDLDTITPLDLRIPTDLVRRTSKFKKPSG
ncbi:MAG: FHA domain-containing protein [Anaerolineales bacterium]|nr:FHA domain-containing protein [Anaerolineales bacterium]